MRLIHAAESRTTETPNARMTTLASASLGGTVDHAVWRVRMAPGQAGPVHTFDTEQVWTAVCGAATVEAGDVAVAVEAGDTVVFPEGELRRVAASDDAHGFEAIVVGRPGAIATRGDGSDAGVPPWIA